MFRSEKELTDVEMIDALMDIIEIVLAGNNKPIRDDFKRYSRMAQIGYDVTVYLFHEGIINPGEPNEQIKMKKEELCQEK